MHAREPALRAALCILLVVAICVGFPLSAVGAERAHVTVVFRYDDYSATSKTETDRAVIEMFRKHGLCLTISAIPFRVTKDESQPDGVRELAFSRDKRDLLRAAAADGTVEVAMHGYRHVSVTPYRPGKGNEWATVAYETQKKQLVRGRAFLEELAGSSVTTFCPPWNSYDANTVRALSETGFSCLSASRRGETVGAGDLRYLPATCFLRELQSAVASARRMAAGQSVIIVQLHPFDYVEEGKAPRQDVFDRELGWVASQEGLRVVTLGQAAQLVPDLDAGALTANKWYTAAAYLAPPILGSATPTEFVYLGGEIAPKMAVKAWAVLAGAYGAVAAILAVAFGMLGRAVLRPGWMGRTALVLWPVVVLGAGALAVRSANRNWRGAMLAAGVFGMSVGLAWAWRRARKRRMVSQAEPA